jgi:hypothetical protein
MTAGAAVVEEAVLAAVRETVAEVNPRRTRR